MPEPVGRVEAGKGEGGGGGEAGHAETAESSLPGKGAAARKAPPGGDAKDPQERGMGGRGRSLLGAASQGRRGAGRKGRGENVGLAEVWQDGGWDVETVVG